MSSQPCGQDCATCLPTAYNFSIEKPAVQLEVAEADGIHVTQITIPAMGTYVPQHSHVYEHLTMLATGEMRVWVEGQIVGDFKAPAPIRIPAEKKHTFLALTDNVTFYCLHNVSRTGVVQELERHELPGLKKDVTIMQGDDGVAIREESFQQFWDDAQPLIAAHSAEIGPREGVTLDVNAQLFERLDRIEALQILTARCNGRLAGYLVSIIGPSLENAKHKVGTQTAFYVSKDFRGIGTKLMRASVDRLREKGCGEVLFRTPTRANGAKAGALFRRMGAQPFGELYSLILEAA